MGSIIANGMTLISLEKELHLEGYLCHFGKCTTEQYSDFYLNFHHGSNLPNGFIKTTTIPLGGFSKGVPVRVA